MAKKRSPKPPTLTIDPEFRDLIPPLTKQESSELEASLVAAGRALDSILTWRGKIVDGHNRFSICTRLDLPYDTRELDLPDRDAVKAWIFQHQLARRNLTTDQIVALACLHSIETARGTVRQRRIAVQLRDAGGSWLADVISGRMTLVVARNTLAAKLGQRQLRRPRVVPTPLEQLRVHEAQAKARDLGQRNRELLRELTDSREALATVAELAAQTPAPVTRRELGSGLREATALALLSDVHGETLVPPGSVSYGNVYNLEIAELRLQRFFASIEWQIRHAASAFAIRDLVLWLGGDLTTGTIHAENVETAQLGPNSAILWMQAQLLAGIRQLAETNLFERIIIPCSFGNHGRTTETMRPATGAEHCREWMMYQTMAQLLSDDERIEIHADRSEHQFLSVYDWQLHFHHGHRLRFKGGTLGIGVPGSKITANWNLSRRCDWHYVGHHHMLLAPTRDLTINGSVIGFDPYAQSLPAVPEPPQQHFELI
jgi:hypothetical protein